MKNFDDREPGDPHKHPTELAARQAAVKRLHEPGPHCPACMGVCDCTGDEPIFQPDYAIEGTVTIKGTKDNQAAMRAIAEAMRSRPTPEPSIKQPRKSSKATYRGKR